MHSVNPLIPIYPFNPAAEPLHFSMFNCSLMLCADLTQKRRWRVCLGLVLGAFSVIASTDLVDPHLGHATKNKHQQNQQRRYTDVTGSSLDGSLSSDVRDRS